MRSRGFSFISSKASSMCAKPWKRCVNRREVSNRPVSNRDANFSIRSRPPGIRPPRMVYGPCRSPIRPGEFHIIPAAQVVDVADIATRLYHFYSLPEGIVVAAGQDDPVHALSVCFVQHLLDNIASR